MILEPVPGLRHRFSASATEGEGLHARKAIQGPRGEGVQVAVAISSSEFRLSDAGHAGHCRTS